MSRIDDIKAMLDNAEYEYTKKCKATGYRYIPFRTMMKIYVILIAIVIIWVL